MAELTKEEIRAKIKSIVTENLGVSEDQVTDDAQFSQDLGADSLDQVELVMSLEEAFGAEIRDEAVTRLPSGRIADIFAGR